MPLVRVDMIKGKDKEYKKTEGNGITIDELNSLVMGMQ